MATGKMKVGMLFRTTASVDLSIMDLDNSPRYIKLGPDMYFRDYSKAYQDWSWDMLLIKHDFDFDCKTFIRQNPDCDFEAEIHLILFGEDNNVLQDVQLEYTPKNWAINEFYNRKLNSFHASMSIR